MVKTTGRIERIRQFLEEIPDEELESGKLFKQDDNIWDNGEFHIDSRPLPVKTNDHKYRKKGEIYWKIDLQQCAQEGDKGAMSKKGGGNVKSNARHKSNVPVQISGKGCTYGVVMINDKLKTQTKAPSALAFKTAMLYSCAEANDTEKVDGRWKCDVHHVLFKEDRSWMDEDTGSFRHEESEYTGAGSKQLEMPDYEDAEDTNNKGGKKNNNKGGKSNKKK
ncbi:hypothetical protein BFW01_g945 [Lasiodiplodia theobromae]|uniref:Uncharacterized protein n=1 Tax=Lasiodiplodia theobromae TaxID=45133 RepID=A0A5N5D4G9_9PEZI|nr:hypothetical protein DBV05_g8695 [Lasiodiplodia theobromae]KAF9630383.1 hypothetical protein BFW01_g945 [Lasiodiplodia theobromae]